MNVNFEAIEKAWFKPKKDVLNELDVWLDDIIVDADNTRKLLPMYSQSEERVTSKYYAFLTIKNKIQELKKENENDNYYRN